MAKLTRFRALVINRPLMLQPGHLPTILDAIGRERLGLVSVTSEPARSAQAIPARLPAEERAAAEEKQIALIDISGELVHRTYGMEAASGLLSYERIRDEVETAALDDSVGGILLRLDSPGGEATDGAWAAASAVREAARIKPVYAVADDKAFSAAYLIAAHASRIFVSPTGGLGSIGVISVHVDESKALEKMGFRATVIKDGERKDEFSSLHGLDEAALERLQEQVDALGLRFRRSVAGALGVSEKFIRNQQARSFYGEEAVAQGLAHELGDFRAAVERLAEEMNGGNSMPDAQRRALAEEEEERKAKRAKRAEEDEDEELKAKSDEDDDEMEGDDDERKSKRASASVSGPEAILHACAGQPQLAQRLLETGCKPADARRFAAAFTAAGASPDLLGKIERGMTPAQFSRAAIGYLADSGANVSAAGALPSQGVALRGKTPIQQKAGALLLEAIDRRIGGAR